MKNKTKGKTTKHIKDPKLIMSSRDGLSNFYLTVDFPLGLIEELNKINFKQKKNKTYAERLLGMFITEMNESNSSINEYYAELSTAYIIKITSDSFYKNYFLKILKGELKKEKNFHSKIIQSNSSYSSGLIGKAYCKKYRINPQYLTKETKKIEVQIQYESLNEIFPEVISHLNNSVELITPKFTKRKMFELISEKSNEFQLIHSTNEFSIIQKDKTHSIPILEGTVSISIPYIRQLNTKKIQSEIINDRKRLDNQEIKLIAITTSNSETKYVLGVPELVMAETKERFQKKCYGKISSIERKEWNPRISVSNGRLNHAFTTLNKFCIAFFKLDGEEIESIDLKSAQPTILANLFVKNDLLKNSLMNSRNPKLIKYLNETKELFFCLDRANLDTFLQTDIYDDLANACKINRSQAKIEVLKILFSEPGFHSKELTQFNKLYPSFGNQLNQTKKAFKEKYSSSKTNFSRFLQMVEGHIFLEKIYIEISKANIPAITKHDSILYASSRKEEIENIINRCFSYLNFKGVMVTEISSLPK